MARKMYQGLDKTGEVIRWTGDTDSSYVMSTWTKDRRVVLITENGSDIWRRK